MKLRFTLTVDASQHVKHFNKIAIPFAKPEQVTCKDSSHLPSLLRRPSVKETMFSEWFILNIVDPRSRHCTYTEIPCDFVWRPTERKWQWRKQCKGIGRIVYTHLASGERYYLRLLLINVWGPRNFEEIRTVNGVVYETFRQACYALGIKEFKFPNLQLNENQLKNYCLLHIKKILARSGKSLANLPEMLPLLDRSLLSNIDNRLIQEKLGYNISCLIDEHTKLPLLIYDKVLHSVTNDDGEFFFVYCASCTGKTFLYTAIMARIRFEKKIALAVASLSKNYPFP
ncbi:hypothetical protein V2J09_016403 [Rumex salicifolius]